MAGLLTFVDILQRAEMYSTRTIVSSASTGSGADVASLPLSNVFDKNLWKVYRRSGIDTTDVVRLDLDLVRANLVSSFPMGVAVIGLLNVSLRDASNVLSNGFTVGFNTNTSGFADSGGTGSITSNNTYLQTEVAPRNIFFIVSALSTTAAKQIGGRPYTGTGAFGRYTRIFMQSFTADNCVLDIGRIVVMPALPMECSADDFVVDVRDDSDVQFSFGGSPYSNVRAAYRVAQFSNQEFYPQGRFDGAGDLTQLATVQAANFYAGKSEIVCLLPSDGFDTATTSYDPRNIAGLLEEPLAAQIVRPGTDANKLFRVSGRIRELKPY